MICGEPADRSLPIDWWPEGVVRLCGTCGDQPAVVTDLLADRLRGHYGSEKRFALLRRGDHRFPYAVEDAEGRTKRWKIYGKADETAFVLTATDHALWRVAVLKAEETDEPEKPSRKRRRRRRRVRIDRTAQAEKED